MNLQKDLEEIKNDVQEETEKETCEQVAPVVDNLAPAPTSFEDAKNQALAEFKPTYDKSKSIYENGKDFARTIGLSEALKDQDFIDEMKEGSKKELKTDMDTDQKKAELENQRAFYNKHKPVLQFARMKEPGGLSLMKWTFAFTIVFYMLSLVIGGIGNLIIKTFDCINDLFNSIVGIPQYYTNSNGDLILDKDGKPIAKSVKVNLLTKIVFWFVFTILALVIVFAIVKGLTGFDIVTAIRNLFN